MSSGCKTVNPGKTVGLLTIGQSPRVDVVPDIVSLIKSDVHIVEKGALDGLNIDDIKKLVPEDDDDVLVSRLKDGTEATLGESKITGLLKNKVDEFIEEGIDDVVLICTADITLPLAGCNVNYAGSLLKKYFESNVKDDYKIAIVCPKAEQKEMVFKKWQYLANEKQIFSASPYGSMDEIKKTAYDVKKSGATYIIFDCMGYDLKMKKIFEEVTSAKAITPREIIAEFIG